MGRGSSGSSWWTVAGRRRGILRGFTLIELVVSIVTGSVIAGIAGSLVLAASRQRSSVAARCELVDITARACEQMLRFIREIPQDAGVTGLAQIDTATATDLRFGNYGFRKTGANIEMTIDNGVKWYPLVRDVTSLAFAYTNRTGTALSSFPLSLADRQAVRMVQVRLTLARGSETRTIQTSIYLRSFMSEVIHAP